VSDVVARKASLAVNRGAVRPLASRHGEIRGNGNGVFKRLEAQEAVLDDDEDEDDG
jgi:hypothetical protein